MSHALTSQPGTLVLPRAQAARFFITGLAGLLWFAAPAVAHSHPMPYVAQYSVQELGKFKPTALNDKGQVVGYADHSYFYDGTKLVDLTATYGLTGAPWALNNLGQIAGWRPSRHAYLFQDGHLTNLPGLGGDSLPLELNDSGEAVGESSRYQGGTYEAVLYSGGKMMQLTKGGGAAFGINNSGQVVGSVGNYHYHAFLYANGGLTDLGTLPGHSTSGAAAINNKGQIVGGSGGDAFLYQDGEMTDLGHMTVNGRAVPTHAYDINDSGTIIGTYERPYEASFVYENGQFRDLSSLVDPQFGGIVVSQINNAGQILGFSGAPFHAYLLTPIPEPTAAFLIPLAARLLIRRRE